MMTTNIQAFRAFLAAARDADPVRKACDLCDRVTEAKSITSRSLAFVTFVTGADMSRAVPGAQSHTAQAFEPSPANDLAPEPDAAYLDEREAIALEGGVSPAFARAFAYLQVMTGDAVDPAGRDRAADDAGLFLDAWGAQAERHGWSADDLFSPAGLAWSLEGSHVTHLTRAAAILADGRTFTRSDRGQA